MVNVRCWIAVVFIGVLLSISSAWAIDYTVFSNQELFKLKKAVSNASVEEQDAYRQEWQARLKNMGEEERKQYAGESQNRDGNDDMTVEEGKIPFVIQGQGYDKQGTGTVIFGGMPSGKGAKKSGGGNGR